MKIADIRSVPLEIPFSSGGPTWELSGQQWKTLDSVLVRVEMDDGTVGWGDAFAYHCREAVHAALEKMVAPIAVGRDARDISALMTDLQRRLHLYHTLVLDILALQENQLDRV